MKHAAPPGRARRSEGNVTAALVAGVALCVAPADASAAPGAERHVSFGPFAGTIVLDPHLSDFRWDTRARAVWGAAGRADVGRVGAGVRVWRATTAQSTGIPGADVSPEVKLTGSELVGEVRVARIAGFRLLTSGTLGLLHIGYAPDAITVDDGSGQTIDVGFDPITEWSTGLGVGVRRSLVGGLDASVALERSWFRLDTTHRVGTAIVQDRETFGHWTARVELSHRILQI